jgi:hypothetical protein
MRFKYKDQRWRVKVWIKNNVKGYVLRIKLRIVFKDNIYRYILKIKFNDKFQG